MTTANQIGFASKSRAVNLTEDAAGVVTIASTTDGLVNGLIAKVTGVFNGGATTAVGLANTLGDAGLMLAGGFADRAIDGRGGIPIVGKLLGKND